MRSVSLRTNPFSTLSTSTSFTNFFKPKQARVLGAWMHAQERHHAWNWKMLGVGMGVGVDSQLVERAVWMQRILNMEGEWLDNLVWSCEGNIHLKQIIVGWTMRKILHSQSLNVKVWTCFLPNFYGCLTFDVWEPPNADFDLAKSAPWRQIIGLNTQYL